MKKQNSSRGFTLVELLIVISIIAILTGIIITGLTASKSKSRDAQRISDLNQIQLALEQYFDRCGQYPTDIYANQNCSAGVSFINFITNVPADPSTHVNYEYYTNASVNTGIATDYMLRTVLENENQVQVNSFTEASRVATDWTNGLGQGRNAPRCYDVHTLYYCISTK